MKRNTTTAGDHEELPLLTEYGDSKVEMTGTLGDEGMESPEMARIDSSSVYFKAPRIIVENKTSKKRKRL